ncbi:DUF6252 family protein [Ichthyenterobacterium magnum]|uniref:Thrombospondin type 3 repeat-containing protein n=1 Tax=Ichthyenterobacterium magnum TaxID=1230530 RepID=A0A420DW95_9FLAO|nr:DUF6252 family protein [Ichthyenterobacterium magnum]RKE98485.1 hypothetical protein BXY80_0574 [Ichthyenterobacterium magnum]
MKKLAVLLITFLTLVSCGDEVEFNTPAFQGNKDYVLWRAEFFNAAIDDNGYLTITGGNNIETVELTIPSVAVGTYTLGDVSSMAAKFTAADGTVYSTNNRPDPSVSIYPEYGFIKLDEIIDNTFTGTFEFLAFDTSGLNSVGFNEGIFFRVPLISGAIPAAVYTCVDAQDDAALALAAYQSTFAPELEFIDSAAYLASCAAYKTALETQMTYCGDVSGDIQSAINDLNDCVFPCNFAVANSNAAQANLETATIGNYIEACTAYKAYLQQQIDFCGDDDGSIQALIDATDCGDDDSDGVPNIFEDFDGDGVFDDDTDADGIFNYLDNDDDGDGVLTIDEAKDADGNPIDTDGDGDVDYLDTDDDGDGIITINETGDTDGDGVPDHIDNDDDGDGVFTIFELGDTDMNGVLNYLDNDDDGDGMPTVDENADPNGDGNPADALDTDMNGIPDYLQA